VSVVCETQWELAPAAAELDPARGLGELANLPESPHPGDWCTIVVGTKIGEIRWTFVARELERTTSIFLDRWRPQVASQSEERVAEREGTDGMQGPARTTRGWREPIIRRFGS
jgi:hypothetical protein